MQGQANEQPINQAPQRDWTNHEFRAPKKDLAVIEQMEAWKRSRSYMNYMQFVADLQQSVASKKISATPSDAKFEPIVKMLEDFEKWIQEIPPVKQPMRFGNTAFRTWHDKVQAVILSPQYFR